MGRRPQLPAVRRAAWLALGLSGTIHGLFLALLPFLPEGRRQADGPVTVTTVVLLSDDGPRRAAAAPVPPPAAPATAPPQERLVSPRVLPEGPVPVGPDEGPSEPTAPPGPAVPAPGAGTAGSAGGRTGPLFFQVHAEGNSVVYVIDRSASMGLGDGLTAAKAELLASLRQLPASARFQVICYSRDADALRIAGRSDLVHATADNVRETARLLQSLRAGGSTNHVQALQRALALEPDVIFLVTDAADLSPEQVRQVTRWNAGRTRIHAIELGDADPAGGALEVLARSNGGHYRRVPLAATE